MSEIKGIILAGGSGTRLYPLTKGVTKQLLPIYDKPMIYYPLYVLLMMGIRDICIISTLEDQPNFQRLLEDGSSWGVHLTYIVQPKPEGIAQAFILAEKFIDKQPVCLVLGDNIFFGHGLDKLLQNAFKNIHRGATVFAYYVKNPERYGVVTFDEETGFATELLEKPTCPKSNYVVTGLYFYDETVVNKAKCLKPSLRGELEITDLNMMYLQESNLRVQKLDMGMVWLDAGLPKPLLQASTFVETVQDREGRIIGCLEEVAYNKHLISLEQLRNTYEKNLGKSEYAEYVKEIIKTEESKKHFYENCKNSYNFD